MAYAAWSVIAGEQPTTAKWNILGTNDSSFNDGSGIGSTAIATAALANAAVTTSKLKPTEGLVFASANLTLTNAYQDVTGVTFSVTPVTASVLRLVVFANVTSNATDVNIQLLQNVNSGGYSAQTPIFSVQNAGADSMLTDVSKPMRFLLAAGSTYQYKIQAQRGAGGSGSINGTAGETGLSYLLVSQ